MRSAFMPSSYMYCNACIYAYMHPCAHAHIHNSIVLQACKQGKGGNEYMHAYAYTYACTHTLTKALHLQMHNSILLHAYKQRGKKGQVHACLRIYTRLYTHSHERTSTYTCTFMHEFMHACETEIQASFIQHTCVHVHIRRVDDKGTKCKRSWDMQASFIKYYIQTCIQTFSGYASLIHQILHTYMYTNDLGICKPPSHSYRHVYMYTYAGGMIRAPSANALGI